MPICLAHKNTSLWAYDVKHKTKIYHIVTSIPIEK